MGAYGICVGVLVVIARANHQGLGDRHGQLHYMSCRGPRMTGIGPEVNSFAGKFERIEQEPVNKTRISNRRKDYANEIKTG